MARIKGAGTRLQVTIASVYTDIGQLVAVTPPNPERGDIDATELGMSWKEWLPTIPDGGEASFKLNYDPELPTHAALWASFVAGNVEGMKVILPNAAQSEIRFSAYVKTHPWDEVAIEGLFTTGIGVKVSGAITIDV